MTFLGGDACHRSLLGEAGLHIGLVIGALVMLLVQWGAHCRDRRRWRKPLERWTIDDVVDEASSL